jgi:hypothetical protein
MFSIGGVSALKQHPFFEFLDWFALERLQVTPPFEFSIAASNPGSVAVGAGGAAAGTSLFDCVAALLPQLFRCLLCSMQRISGPVGHPCIVRGGRITVPILYHSVSVMPYSPITLNPNPTGTSNTATPEKSGPQAAAGAGAYDPSSNFALQFFDAEFTNQQLSLSMLEDTLVSHGGTPMRSGAVSRDEGELTCVLAALFRPRGLFPPDQSRW